MLNGRQVKLRAWREEDLGFFQDLRNDVDAQVLLMSEPRPHTMADTRHWLETRTADRNEIFFVIEYLPDADAIGFVELRAVRATQGHAMLGIYLAPSARGRGLAAEAMELILRFAADVMALRKILLHVYEGHLRAIRLYERAGFERVGVHRSHFYFAGRFHDVLVMEKILSASRQDATIPWMQ